MDIVVTRRSDDYHACNKDNSGERGCGRSQHEAVCNMITAHTPITIDSITWVVVPEDDKIRWVTNCFESDVAKYKHELHAGDDRFFGTGEPKETVAKTVQQLRDMNVVGLYSIAYL